MSEDTHLCPGSLDLEQEEVHPGACLAPLVLSSWAPLFLEAGPCPVPW